MTSLGQNTLAADELRGFVERLEAIDARKRDLAEDRKVVMAEANQKGLVPKFIAYVVKVRKMKPHDRAEAESLRDLYLHAMGLDEEPPLFRAVGLIEVDIHARESVIAALEKFVPAKGEIVITVGTESVRLWRTKDGTVMNEPIHKRTTNPEVTNPEVQTFMRRPDKPAAPDVSEDEAFALGEQAARNNEPVIDNPFPFGDTRRAHFDEGWRKANGGDGMGGS